jgi:hypothetical protein
MLAEAFVCAANLLLLQPENMIVHSINKIPGFIIFFILFGF